MGGIRGFYYKENFNNCDKVNICFTSFLKIFVYSDHDILLRICSLVSIMRLMASQSYCQKNYKVTKFKNE